MFTVTSNILTTPTTRQPAAYLSRFDWLHIVLVGKGRLCGGGEP